jgi:hypothetical protein
VEHRKATRTAVNGALLAYTGKKPEDSDLWRVIDIGPGGLSLKYVADRPLPEGSFTVTLSPPQNRIALRNLPVTTVSDVPTGETAPFSNISVRRRGLKFEGFPLHQRMMLRWLVHRCGAD